MTEGRWYQPKSTRVPTPKVDAFLAEIAEVCRRHGFEIGHEDVGGGFVISSLGDDDPLNWLGWAAVDATVEPEDL